MSAEPTYFKTPAVLRRWFAKHASTSTELVVGFMKTGSGQPSITWPESVDEALCVGWIDGVRHRINDARYKIRFTPRKPSSHWSDVNIRRVAELQAQGRMQPAGLAAFARRTEARSRRASYEQAEVALAAADVAQFQRHAAAWQFFEGCAATYRKKASWWVISAKREETRARRLAQLIECSQARRLL